MNGCRRLLAALVVCLTLVSTSAEAQPLTLDDPPPGPPRLDVSGSGGFLTSTDWSDLVVIGSVSASSGVLEQVLVRDLVVDPGPVYDTTVTYWEGRYGFRAHVGYGKSCLAVGRSCGDIAAVTNGGTVSVKSYSYDVGGAIGLIDYKPARSVWPYVFVGVGGITYDLDRTIGPPLSFIERQPTGDTAAIIGKNPETVLISIDELGVETKLAVNAGVGTDFRIPLGAAGLGVRLELSDLIHESPIRVQVAALDAFRRDDASLDFGIIHNLRAAVGIVLQFGR
jgi:hypothetical protein